MWGLAPHYAVWSSNSCLEYTKPRGSVAHAARAPQILWVFKPVDEFYPRSLITDRLDINIIAKSFISNAQPT
jgi:hypothetical protein